MKAWLMCWHLPCCGGLQGTPNTNTPAHNHSHDPKPHRHPPQYRGASARYRRRDGLSRDAAPTGARHATRCTFCTSARIAAECVRCNSERGGKIQRSRSSVTMWIRSGHSPSSAPIRACKKSSALSTCLSSPCPRTSPPAAAPAVHFRGAVARSAAARRSQDTLPNYA